MKKIRNDLVQIGPIDQISLSEQTLLTHPFLRESND